MMFSLSKFSIRKLHGDTDIDISIQDNKLVIVADNGIGKTTIVNIIYYTLSRQWFKLSEYNFQSIAFTINQTFFEFLYDDLENFSKLRRFKRSFRKSSNLSVSKIIDEIFEIYDINEVKKSKFMLESISEKYSIPPAFLWDMLNDFSSATQSNKILMTEIDRQLGEQLDCQILYLPTYRRIEKDLKIIFPELDTDLDSFRRRRQITEEKTASRFIELVDFGMADVQAKVENKLNVLYLNFSQNVRQSLMGGYLKDILNKDFEKYDYRNFIHEITVEKIGEILNRIDNSILQVKEKESLRSFVDTYQSSPDTMKNEDKIIAYFIQKLFDIYAKQSLEEADVNKFVELCNIYCTNKTFMYSREDRKIKIYLNEQEKEITFSMLSSGEKQIVSLFSHLYLSDNKNFFVIIDEPELSLSVEWQERFLPDILNAYNSGLIAVTHSPFIFRNSLTKYTKGFNEFLTIA